MSENRALGCFAGGAGFVIGFILAVVVIAGGFGMLLADTAKHTRLPGIVMITASVATIIVVVTVFRRIPLPFMQGLLIGAATASVLTGLCGAILAVSN